MKRAFDSRFSPGELCLLLRSQVKRVAVEIEDGPVQAKILCTKQASGITFAASKTSIEIADCGAGAFDCIGRAGIRAGYR